jgi:hypothetical protein
MAVVKLPATTKRVLRLAASDMQLAARHLVQQQQLLLLLLLHECYSL